MDIFAEKKMRDETLSGVSSVHKQSDDREKILKPVGDDLGSVVVTTTVVETTEVSVVEMVQDVKEDGVMKNQDLGERNEVIKNEIEGVFGDMPDDDDDDDDDENDRMNVNCGENGTSHGMDVDAIGVNPVLEGEAVVLADEYVENGSRDPMDIRLSAEKEQDDGNGTTVMAMEDLNKNVEENVDMKEDDGLELAENKEEEEGHDFVVGDFVWGTIKSQPWWPGQIHDPSDASENVAKLKQEGQFLVSFFGERSFSWCSPSQLKPFVDHFQEMTKQSDSKKFVNAVKMALGEVGRLMEAGLMCKCEPVSRLGSSGVVKRGIKKGVRMPKGNTIKVLMDRIEPVELFSTLKGLATMDIGSRLAELELTLLKSSLNVFYRTRGGYLVQCKTKNNGPLDSIDNRDGKSYKGKQKSVAELMRDDEIHEPKIKKSKITKDGGSGKRKRKALVVSVTPESENETGGDGGVEDETMSPRQRKKSKYLSPPYLSPVGNGKLSLFASGSGSGSFKEPKPEVEKVPEIAGKHLEESSKSSGKRTRQKRGTRDASDAQEEQKETVSADMDVNEVLLGLLLVALDPTSSVEKNLNVPAIVGFISSYRSSVFKDDSSYLTDQKTDQKTANNQKLEGDRKKKAGSASDLAFIKQKLESMIGMVQRCEETEMNREVKASLEGGMQEVLQKVGKMKGK